MCKLQKDTAQEDDQRIPVDKARSCRIGSVHETQRAVEEVGDDVLKALFSKSDSFSALQDTHDGCKCCYGEHTTEYLAGDILGGQPKKESDVNQPVRSDGTQEQYSNS